MSFVRWLGTLALAVAAQSIAARGRAVAPIAAPEPIHPHGRFGPSPWTYTRTFDHEVSIGAIRARWSSTTSGVPIRYTWEIRACGSDAFAPIAEAGEERPDPTSVLVLPRVRTWFVSAVGCALRLSVRGTNGGVPALQSLEVHETAKNVLAGAAVEAAGSAVDEDPAAIVDGTYERSWRGIAGRGRWTLTVRLARPVTVDRVRLLLGNDATTTPRSPIGRTYAMAAGPIRWELEASDDGRSFAPVAASARRDDGSFVAARRPFVRISPRLVTALRLHLLGATNDAGQPTLASAPVVREIFAYAADDPRPVLAEPWVLSINANPAASSHLRPGGELANDLYFAKFLQMRFASLLPSMQLDDRIARSLGPSGELVDAPRGPSDGRALETIEGDDPALDAAWLTASWPPPLAVLSGSNDWEYARRTYSAPKGTMQWNPLRDARDGGMGNLASVVRERKVPLVGFCGGAQILALLEAREDGSGREIDRILRRNNGRPIRGSLGPLALIRAWPGETQRLAVSFLPDDPLFVDIAGPKKRASTHAFAHSHLDLVRPDAFLPGAPLERFEILATSRYCGPTVLASLRPPFVEANPTGAGRCTRVTEVFRAKDGEWPLVGAQFHAEQREFATPAPQDPPESVADPRLFVAAIYDRFVDAYLRNAFTKTGPSAP